jgi:hypothetical protein
MGVRVASVEMPFPECAIDVDRPADLDLATRIVQARDGRTHPLQTAVRVSTDARL